MPSTVAIFWPLRRAQYSAGPAVESPLKVLKPATTLLIFGDYPNIKGGFAIRPVSDFGYLSGSFTQTNGSKKTADCALNEASQSYFKQISLDASKSSSLYQNGVTEVRVNAIYGLNLIRAF